MSGLWFLSLLFALWSSQQCSASSEAVSLNCSKTVAVEAGKPVTLNCTIGFSYSNCRGYNYSWKTTRGDIPCDNKYNCKWDNETYVSLTISDVEKEENYTIKVDTDCGRAISTVRVEVITHPYTNSSTDQPTATNHHVTAALCVIFFTVALGIMCFLFQTGRCRKSPRGHSAVDNTPLRDDLTA